MDLKQIEKLMVAMQEAKMKRICIKREGFEIELERECSQAIATPSFTTYYPQQEVMQQTHTPPQKEAASIQSQEQSPSCYVTSPMVGTYYSSPSPEDPTFVKEGDQVNENTVMCIIEAMKVMNEVKAGIKGRVVEILIKNGDPVEFGTKIFRIEQ